MCMFLLDLANPIVIGNPRTKNTITSAIVAPNTCITILSNGSPITIISNAPANIIAMTIPIKPVIAK